MDTWTIQCLVWVSLVLSPSYGYRDIYDQEDYNINQQRYIPNQQSDINTEDRRGYERSSDDRSAASERSIPFDFNVQRVQDNRRPIDDGVRRNVNSTLKIVNNFAKPLPILSNRRGAAGHHQETTKSSISDNVVFPGPTARTSSFVPLITDKQCLETGICEDIPNYPQDRVNEVVKQLTASSYKFNVDRLVTPEIAQRIGPHDEMLELCKSRETVIAPKAVRDTSNKWYVVLNEKNKTIQGYRVEICDPASVPCSDLIYVVSSSYNKTCVQKHQYRQMVVLTESGNYMEKEFKVPSCCSCAIYAVSQFGNR